MHTNTLHEYGATAECERVIRNYGPGDSGEGRKGEGRRLSRLIQNFCVKRK